MTERVRKSANKTPVRKRAVVTDPKTATEKAPENAAPAAAPAAAAPSNPHLELEDEFYRLLAGGSKIAMLLTMVDSGLALLLHQRKAMTEDEIISALGFHRGRGQKFLHILRSISLLIPEAPKPGAKADENPQAVKLHAPSVVTAIVDPTAPNHFFYRDFLRYWRIAAGKDHVALLRGAKVSDPVRYPPVLWEDVLLLHDWMRDGALVTLSSIRKRVDFGKYRRMLDVAGGDATMAIQLVKAFPELSITVFNLPAAAALCRRNVAAAGLSDRIKIVEGDFRVDSFPKLSGGYDLVQFSRVMADWDSDVCRMLMKKSHAVLKKGGHLLIAEPLRDDNPDLSIVWEHSYLPYDDFGSYVYKYKKTYQDLLTETGFQLIAAHGRNDTIHSVLLSEKT